MLRPLEVDELIAHVLGFCDRSSRKNCRCVNKTFRAEVKRLPPLPAAPVSNLGERVTFRIPRMGDLLWKLQPTVIKLPALQRQEQPRYQDRGGAVRPWVRFFG
jgi:hypothetical protein